MQNGTYLLSVSVKDAYDNEATAEIKLTVEDAVTYSKNITNGNFETGDLTGWTAVDVMLMLITRLVMQQPIGWKKSPLIKKAHISLTVGMHVVVKSPDTLTFVNLYLRWQWSNFI